MHKAEQLPLARLQAWFLTAMTAPGGALRGMELAQHQHGLREDEVFKSAAGRQARLHIYADGYVQRLLECLQSDFPVLRKTMGAELFDFFARVYIWRHPSRSPTLYDLGGGFADFLAASQPPGASGQLRFPLELARLERARSEAGRAEGLEQRARSMLDVGWLIGGETPIRLAPCTRLLALSFPLHTFWREAQAASEDAMPPQPEAGSGPSHVAIARRDYRLSMHSLLPWQFHLLQAAQQPAASLQAGALHAARACDSPVEQVLADAMLWLPLAAAAGMTCGAD